MCRIENWSVRQLIFEARLRKAIDIAKEKHSKLQISNQETLDAMKETDDIISGRIKSNPVSLGELKKLIG